MGSDSNTTRSIGSMDDVCEIALAKGRKAYELVWPEQERGDYSNVMSLVGQLDNSSTDAPREILRQFLSDEEVEADARWFALSLFVPTIEPRVDGKPIRPMVQLFMDEVEFLMEFATHRMIAPIYCATAYVYRAQRAQLASDFTCAWANAAQALYWSGIAETSANFGDVINEIRSNEQERTRRNRKRTLALAGGDAVSEKKEMVQEYAFGLVRDRMPPSKWSSMNSAAGTIFKDVRKFMKENDLPHNEDADEASIRRQVVRLLGAMPDGADYFRKFQVKSKA